MLEKTRPDAEGMEPITVRISIEGSRAEFYLGKKVHPDHWDKKEKRVDTKKHPNIKEARAINNAIIQCLAKLENDYNALHEKCPLCSASQLKKAYNGDLTENESDPEAKKEEEPEKERTICQILNYKYSKFAVLAKKKKRSQNTLKRWKTTKRKLRQFLYHSFKMWDVPISTIKFGHADDFLHYLLTQDDLQENTANKYVKNVRELLQIAERKEWVQRNKWDGFKIKYKQPERECLSMQEIITLYQKPLIERLDHVRNIFLFSCFTGYAFQEVFDFTKDDIFIGMDGKRWIKIDRQKTGNPEYLSLLPIPAAIIDRYANDPYCVKNNKLLPIKNYHNYNGYLKEVAYICEIPIELSTHIARHTFATTICLDHDVPIETVSKMLGHKSIRTTQIYAKVSRKKISNNMNELERKLFTSDGKLKIEVMPVIYLQKQTTSVAV
jgi:site-specific recombinase XerD